VRALWPGCAACAPFDCKVRWGQGIWLCLCVCVFVCVCVLCVCVCVCVCVDAWDEIATYGSLKEATDVQTKLQSHELIMT
jgi:hypothetical protein